jgi:hypothetical protein
MTDCLTQYYRCPERYVRSALIGPLSGPSGYFRFSDRTLYGRYSGRHLPDSPSSSMPDALSVTTVQNGEVRLPFDFDEVIDSLRYERYVKTGLDNISALRAAVNGIYYFIRPTLPVGVRKYLQRLRLSGWERIPFPSWPVDRSVDTLAEQMLLLSLRATGVKKIPFIWFWPEGAPSCAIMTHDVETRVGRDFCADLMDMDDSFGIKASFQVVPEDRYEVTPGFLQSITNRGFVLAVQDLNHDGRLFKDYRRFVTRAQKINAYGRQWGAEGFRSAILYRRQEWFDALEFSYDMSVPNVAHLDPQHGGCCTVMPYFVGKILELPVTATQDYTLFNILNDYSLDLWKSQIDLIMERHGLISFIVHPDYVTTPREMAVYKALLGYLAQLREEKGVWMATADEVSRWWRQRAEMTIVEDGEALRIEGAGSERARLAYASEKDGRLVFTLSSASASSETTLVEQSTQ